jgi:hypothetical protein
MSPVIGTPANLAEGSRPSSASGSGRPCRCRPGCWRARPMSDVTHVIYRGDVVVVTGNSNALNAVTSALACDQILARQLRVAFGLAAARFFPWE